MAGQEAEPGLVALRRCWRRWAAVVELYARRRRGRLRVDAEAYGRLHQGLLETCRKAKARGERKELCENLESLAQPWLSPRVLAQADVEILQDLLLRVRQAEQELGGRRRSRMPAWVAGAACVLAGAAVLAVWAPSWPWQSALRQARALADAAWAAVKHSSVPQRTFAAGAAVSLATIYLVARMSRKA